MRSAGFVLFLAVFLALPIWSCSDDDNPVSHKYPPSPYKCLETTCPRDNVLHNLQQSYNDRNISRYDELLDADFLFYFSAADVSGGMVTAEYWSRAAEINANTNLFDPNYSNPSQGPAQDIDLVLTYTESDSEWTPNPAPDQVKYPGETWYEKTVTYNLTVLLPGQFQYICYNKNALFTVRAGARGDAEVWQVIVWRDDVEPGLHRRTGGQNSAGLVKPSTWGRVKALYAE
jgi:hypothetical protein